MYSILSTLILLLTLNFCSTSNMASSSVANDSGSSEEMITPLNAEQPVNAFFNEDKADIGKIEAVLKKVKDIDNINDRIIAITQEFVGTPYIGGTLNLPSEETLYVNTTGVDCTTFVETVIALALASEQPNPDVNAFLRKLKSIRYRNGEIDGYPSRLHYISEWAIDNEKRGNFSEITNQCNLSEPRVKTIDYMTKNRSLYSALANDTVFEAIKENEKQLKNLHHSIIPTSLVNKAANNFLKNGDIVSIVTNKPGLDVSHVGIINIKNGIPHMIHASSKYKKVINDTVSLEEYLQKQKSPGIRVFRLK